MKYENLWEKYIKPSRLIGNLYFVGTYEASTHLIDTGDGLILIDPGYCESLYMVINNIWELGFKPTDIKYIIVTHAHYDHADATEALVHLTNAKTFIGKKDLPLLKGEIFHYPLKSFAPDFLLEDNDVIALGNTQIKCLSTPGHTEGTMSFFFDVEEGGQIYRAGMFGGAGNNTLGKGFLIKNNLSFDIRDKFLDSIDRLLKEKVDVFIGNHVQNNHTDEKIKMLGISKENPFIVPGEWEEFLLETKKNMLHIIATNQ